jgi:hypothetical protein
MITHDRMEAVKVSYPVGTRALFLLINCAGCEGDLSPPSGARIKNAWNCTPLPIYLYGMLLNRAQGQFTLLLHWGAGSDLNVDSL